MKEFWKMLGGLYLGIFIIGIIFGICCLLFDIFTKKTKIGKEVRKWFLSNKVISSFASAIVSLLLYLIVKSILFYNSDTDSFPNLKELLAVAITVFWVGLGIYSMTQDNFLKDKEEK